MKNKIKFAKLRKDVIIPTKREEDGAFDVYANFEEGFMIINPHETKMIHTGLISAFSSDYVALLKERGSTGIRGIGQRAGVVDSGYRGEWIVPVTNHNNIPLVIAKEDCDDKMLNFYLTGAEDFTKKIVLYPYEKAIAQCIMVEVPKLQIEEVSVEDIKSISSERGEGKLGSSGK